MIVVNASALLEFLLQTPLDTRADARLFRDCDEFHASEALSHFHVHQVWRVELLPASSSNPA